MLRIIFSRIAVSAGILIGSGLCAASYAGMLPGSFLRAPVMSCLSLVKQVDADKLVADRYARLFQMSPGMVQLAFSHLHLTHLAKPCMLDVYYVHSGETLGYRIRRMEQGTLVFSLPDGTPMLMQVCGNPLRPHLPGAAADAQFHVCAITNFQQIMPSARPSAALVSLVSSDPLPELSSYASAPGILPMLPQQPLPDAQGEALPSLSFLSDAPLLAGSSSAIGLALMQLENWISRGSSSSRVFSPSGGILYSSGGSQAPSIGGHQAVTPEANSITALITLIAGWWALLIARTERRKLLRKRQSPNF